jgi:Flp pilus assembly protein TadG
MRLGKNQRYGSDICPAGLAAFRKDRSGAMTPIFAVMGTLLVGTLGIGFDLGRLCLVRGDLQAAADAAAVAAARASQRDHQSAVPVGRATFANHMRGKVDGVMITIMSPKPGAAIVEVSLTQPLMFASLFGWQQFEINLFAEASLS